MNKQLQRFRTLKDLIHDNVLEEDEIMLDKLEALSKQLVS